MPSIEVCYSPYLIPQFELQGKRVVVIDVLRATSSMCVAFQHGAKEIIPVGSVDDAMKYRAKGYLVGAERNGMAIAEFDFGNSPFSFMTDNVKDAKIAISTTNGTQAIVAAHDADEIWIGSFLNLDQLVKELLAQPKDLICLCAGWKNKFNLEDTLLSGAIVDLLLKSGVYTTDCDSSVASQLLYSEAKTDLFKFLDRSAHRKRLAALKIEKDIEYCLTPNQCSVVPKMINYALRLN